MLGFGMDHVSVRGGEGEGSRRKKREAIAPHNSFLSAAPGRMEGKVVKSFWGVMCL